MRLISILTVSRDKKIIVALNLALLNVCHPNVLSSALSHVINSNMSCWAAISLARTAWIIRRTKVPTQIANGVVNPAGAPAGTKAAAALGEMEREGAAAKAGTAKAGAAKTAAVGEMEREAVAAKAGAAKAGAAKTGAAVAKTGMGTAAATPAATGGAAAGTKAAALGAGKVAAGAKVAGGTIWTGKGLALGLGLGLGAWGPVILGVVGAGAVYAYMKSRDMEAAQSDEEVELRDALA